MTNTHKHAHTHKHTRTHTHTHTHTYSKFIEQIRTKVQEMKQREWRVEFRWIKAHAGHRGNEMADQQAKEAARDKNIDECYIKIPKSVVTSEQKEKKC